MTIDLLKQELEIGDFVVYNPPRYKGIEIGKIIKLTPRGVTVKGNKSNKTCNRFSNDVIKINEQTKIAMEKYPEHYI